MKTLSHRDIFVPVLTGLVALAWATLWLWERSPYGRYLSHAELGTLDLTAGFSPVATQAGFYVAGWLLMTVAMMLPTTLPLLAIFRRLTRERPDGERLLGLVIAGYLGIWLAFGVAAHLFDLGLHRAFDRSPWLQANPWLFGAAPLVAAGIFQFTALKYRCLDKCRAPLSFVMQHWHRGTGGGRALLLGAHHGAYCVGCCWALMLLMFAVGTGNVGWMLVLASVMAIEKNAAWGRRLSAPLGVTLITWGALIVLDHAWSWQA